MENLIQLKDFMASPFMGSFLFYLVASLAVALSIGVISDKNVIRAGFILIGVFGAISGLFLLLQAQFLALAQIMIYAVGITLVVVIALMLTNPRSEKDTLQEDEELASAPEPGFTGFIKEIRIALPALVGVLSFFTIHAAIRSESWPISNEAVGVNNVQILGQALTTTYSLPFEFASILLLAALIGAIMLAKAEPRIKQIEPTTEE